MMTSAFLVIAGLIFLSFGGDGLVRGAVGIATKLKLSPMFVGLVLVGFGTSMPELATSLQAQFAGWPGLGGSHDRAFAGLCRPQLHARPQAR